MPNSGTFWLNSYETLLGNLLIISDPRTKFQASNSNILNLKNNASVVLSVVFWQKYDINLLRVITVYLHAHDLKFVDNLNGYDSPVWRKSRVLSLVKSYLPLQVSRVG